MVQRRVEHPLLLFGPARDPDSAQSLVPALAGLFPDGVDYPNRKEMKQRIFLFLICLIHVLALFPKSADRFFSQYNFKSVSYTHLDVYKRQT